MEFTTNVIDITPAGTTGWQSVDISAHVPATCVMVSIISTTSGNKAVGARHPSDIQDQSHNAASDATNFYMHAGVSSQQIALFRDSVSQSYYLIGYYVSTDGASFSAPTSYTPATGSWQDVDISAQVPVGYDLALLNVRSPFAITGYVWNVRAKGSSDNRLAAGSLSYYGGGAIVKLDSGRVFQAYRSHTNQIFYLMGYLKSGTNTMKTNGMDESISPAGWTDIDLFGDAPSAAVAAVVEIYSGSSPGYVGCLRCDGSTDDFSANLCNNISHAVVTIDSDDEIEGKINNSAVDFFVLGYLNDTSPAVAAFTSDVQIGSVPLTVNFSDNSTGNPTYYEWDFGDGSPISHDQNPTHDYVTNGKFTVTLTVSNAYGWDSEIKVDYITTYNVGTADLTLPSLRCVADSWGALLTLPTFQCAAGGYWTNYTRMTLPLLRIIAEGGTITNDARLTLPSLTATGQGSSGQVANADLTLPSIGAIGTGIERGSANLTLPALTCSGVMTASSVIHGDMTLPIFTADGFGIAASVGEADLILPSLTCIGYAPAMAVMTLPILQVAGTGLCGEIGEADIELPQLIVRGTGYSIPVVVSTHIILPRLVAIGTGINGNVGNADLTLKSFTFIGQAYSGAIGTANLTLPMETIVASGYGEYIGEADLVLPIFKIEAFGKSILSETYEVYVMNLKNFAISSYEGFNYNSFCNYKNLYLGGSANGIFVLEGDDDDGTDIDATLKTGIEDLGITKLKTIVDAYIGLKAGGIYELRVITSDGNEQVYIIEDNNASIHTLKQTLAKGARARYMTLQFKNKNGSDFEGDNIVLYVDILSRNV